MRTLVASTLGVLFAGSLFAAPAQSQAFFGSCMCEHLGSQYDGLCEATPQTGDELYYWSTWGAAYFPYPTSTTSGFAYYDVWQPGYAGGADVVIVKQSTGQSTSIRCGGWTGGG
jgi:hypothetical protein